MTFDSIPKTRFTQKSDLGCNESLCPEFTVQKMCSKPNEMSFLNLKLSWGSMECSDLLKRKKTVSFWHLPQPRTKHNSDAQSFPATGSRTSKMAGLEHRKLILHTNSRCKVPQKENLSELTKDIDYFRIIMKKSRVTSFPRK
jgi:ATP-dependent helicase YprA (DUF1998 family)